jgi:hypothetical protein
MEPLGDQLARGILSLAKSAREKLESLRKGREKVAKKLRDSPNSAARNHWLRNLRGIDKKIAELQRRNRYLRD